MSPFNSTRTFKGGEAGGNTVTTPPQITRRPKQERPTTHAHPNPANSKQCALEEVVKSTPSPFLSPLPPIPGFLLYAPRRACPSRTDRPEHFRSRRPCFGFLPAKAYPGRRQGVSGFFAASDMTQHGMDASLWHRPLLSAGDPPAQLARKGQS